MSDLFHDNASTSAHAGSAGRQKSKQQNAQGKEENAGSQGALVAVLVTVRESSANQAEGLTRLEEQLKTLETKQEASCEKLARMIRKEKLYSFKRKDHEIQHDFNEKVKETLETAAEALSEENFRDLHKVTATKKTIDKGNELLEHRQKLIKLAEQSEYGWQTVEEYEEDDLAKDSDDEKGIAKAEYRVEKKQKRAAASSNRNSFHPFDHH